MTDQSYHFADGTWRAAINRDVYTVHPFSCERVNNYFILGEPTATVSNYRWLVDGVHTCLYATLVPQPDIVTEGGARRTAGRNARMITPAALVRELRARGAREVGDAAQGVVADDGGGRVRVALA